FTVEYWNGSRFIELDKQTTIGYKRILVFPTIKTNQIRITMEANAAPVIAELQVYKAPEVVDRPFTSEHARASSELNKDKWKSQGNGAVDIGEIVELSGFSYTPPLDKSPGIYVYRYNFYTSNDGKNWTKILNNQT